MAEIKFGFWLLQVSGYTAFFMSLFNSLDSIKSLILFLAGLTFAVIKIYNSILDVRKKDFDLKDYYRLKRKERELDNIKVNKELKDAGENK